MDERKTSRVSESPMDKPIQSEGRKMLEQAFARASSPSEAPAPIHDRAEHSVATQMVVEGLPPAKAERIVAMRRELAELQRMLIDAQQRIATELQGRAEDAERHEAMEARLHAQELKAEQDAVRAAQLETETSSLGAQLASATATVEELRRDVSARAAQLEEVRREVSARDAQLEDVRREHGVVAQQLQAQISTFHEAKKALDSHADDLAARTAERESAQATKSRLEQELEDERKQLREATTQLEAQFLSLRDANARIATHDAERTAYTTERDTAKGELATARAKVHDLASLLVRLGQELLSGGELPFPPSHSHSTPPPVTVKIEDRPKPPPVPARVTPTKPIEAVLEVTEAPRSKSLSALMLVGGVVLGCVATMAFVSLRGTKSTSADEHSEVGASPSAARVAEPASERTAPSAVPSEPVKLDQPSATTDPTAVAPSGSSAQPTPTNDGSGSQAAGSAEATTDGVILLPPEAADHRVYVDGKVVPVKNSRGVVPCGTHEIRIGSHGTPQTLNVACGGETSVAADPHDR
jgi:hypothetical protein